jgi:hypothetical protein
MLRVKSLIINTCDGVTAISGGKGMPVPKRPVEIGVTNRIRTGTNAVTGRDAACYIMTEPAFRRMFEFAPLGQLGNPCALEC